MTVRLIQVRKDFQWENLTPQATFVIQIAMSIRTRFDYILRVVGLEKNILYFQIRDAQNAEHPGSAEHFIDEIRFMSGGKHHWIVMDAGKPSEMIAVDLSNPSLSS